MMNTILMVNQKRAKAPADASPDRTLLLPSQNPEKTLPRPHLVPSLPPGAEKAEETSGEYKLPRLFDKGTLNKLVVSAYKVAGFADSHRHSHGPRLVLLAVNVFYFVSTSWVVPTSLSPADEHVLQLDSIMSQESTAKGALVTQKLQLGSQLGAAKRIIEVGAGLPGRLPDGHVHRPRGSQVSALAAEGALLGSYARSKANILRSNEAYTGMSRDTLASQYDAHVIDKDAMLTGNFQIAQIAGANLALDQKHVEINTQAAELEREIASLQAAQVAAANNKPSRSQYSYEILHIKHEFDESVLASQKAEGDAEALEKSIGLLDQIIGQHDRMMETVQHSPYMMAADKSFTMAFVPYDNRHKVIVGTPVYGCKASFVWCSKVGQVAEIVDGEVVAKHPLHNKDLRGLMVRLNLTDAKWIEQPVLFVGGRPLLF